MDDILFVCKFFFLDMPVQGPGSVARIEAPTSLFVLRIALPERISIS
jgi:hypothetical protein